MLLAVQSTQCHGRALAGEFGRRLTTDSDAGSTTMKSIRLQLLVVFLAVATVCVILLVMGLPPVRPLRLAAGMGRLDEVKRSVRWGTDVDTKGSGGDTALFWASLGRDTKMARFLIDEGANVNTRTRWGQTPLHTALFAWSTELPPLLVANGADVNAAMDDGRMPLHIASIVPELRDVANLLIAKGAKVDIHAASGLGMVEAVAALLEEHPEGVDAKIGNGESALHYAAARGNVQIADALLHRGADINAANDFGDTPLFWAIRNGHTAFAEDLITKGANVNHVNADGRTLLHKAAEEGHRDSVILLLNSGADLNVKDEGYQTPLDLAHDWEMEDFLKEYSAKRGEDLP